MCTCLSVIHIANSSDHAFNSGLLDAMNENVAKNAEEQEMMFSDFLKNYANYPRVSVQGVKSLGDHFACLCRGFEFYEVKRNFFVIIFQKENGNTFTLFIIFLLKSLQKEQNSTNLVL